ncbi:MAG: hypothetical protein KAS07_00645 [Candidatus Pacebacteria bacterium]|nr:hypothetical protein [Candidatus Paceibacterota bacterium]
MEWLTISISLSVFVHFSLAMVIYLGGKTYSSKVFAMLTFIVGLWVIWRGIFHSIPPGNEIWATIANDLSFITGIAIASLWAYFCLVFPEEQKPPRWASASLIFANIVLIPVYFYKDLFLGYGEWIGGIGKWSWTQGPYLPCYDIVFIGLWLVGFIALLVKARRYTGEKRKSIILMFWAVFIGIIPVEITSLVLPRIYNYFELDWTSPLIMIMWSTFMGYTIIKYNQMNTKTVITEFLVLAAVGLLFLSIFI